MPIVVETPPNPNLRQLNKLAHDPISITLLTLSAKQGAVVSTGYWLVLKVWQLVTLYVVPKKWQVFWWSVLGTAALVLAYVYIAFPLNADDDDTGLEKTIFEKIYHDDD